MQLRIVLLRTVLWRISPQISPQKVKKADFNAVSFGLIPFLKTFAVLDHLPESIKVKKKHKKRQGKNTRSSVEFWDHCGQIKTITVVK